MVGLKEDKTLLYNNELYENLYTPGVFYLWEIIRDDKEMLKDALTISKNKYGEDIIKGKAIGHFILSDRENVDQDIYGELLNLVYTNPEISRIDGSSKINDYKNHQSYLLLTLIDQTLVLNKKQKKFAVKEAMNIQGTINKNIENNNPVHGKSPFDIRYFILMNNNWTMEEKAELIYDFYENDQEYDEMLNIWEWKIVNDSANFKDNVSYYLEKEELYNYNYEELDLFYKDSKVTDDIWNQIRMCKLFHEMRPLREELKSKSLTYKNE